MSNTSTASYLNDPHYQSALRHFHLGEWKAGFDELKHLIESNPDDHELQGIQEEMELRAHIDVDEVSDRKQATLQWITKWSIRVVVVVILAGLVYLGAQTYSGWIQNRVSFANRSIDTEIQQIQLAVKFRDGQNLLLAGRADMAGLLFKEIAAINPDYPGLQAEMDKVNNLETLGAKYALATGLIDNNELSAGLSLLKEIKAEDPYFNDVAARIQEVENRISLDDILAKAEAAYQAKDWEKAVTYYETIRITDPSYQTDLVEQRLLDAYLNAATNAMNADSTDVKNLQVAEMYYRKALALKPQDPLLEKEREQARQKFADNLASVYVQAAQVALKNRADSIDALKTAEDNFQKALDIQPDNEKVKVQIQLAQVYLQAQDDFAKGLWDQVIKGLEEVYVEDPAYALGTARQTLYEAYIARGQDDMTAGKYNLALNDFERSAVLAADSSEPSLRVFNAQTKIAWAQGSLGNYQEATQIFQNVFDSLGIVDTGLRQDMGLNTLLTKADNYVKYKNYKMAYMTYNQTAPVALTHYASMINYEIQPGDYLPMIANHYNTTISAILQANNMSLMSLSTQLTPGTTLVIPTVKP